MNILNAKYKTQPMKWDSITFPLLQGTPVNADGEISNDEDAIGMVTETFVEKPLLPALSIVIAGDIDEREIMYELSEFAVAAMSGIRIYKADGSKRSGGIIPTGTISITENGTYDVTQYASASVNVSAEIKRITLNISDDLFGDSKTEKYWFLNGQTWADLIASDQNAIVVESPDPDDPETTKRLSNVGGRVYVAVGDGTYYEKQGLEDFDQGRSILVTDALVNNSEYFIMFEAACLVAGTKIATEKSAKNVENIKVGDVVKSIDPETLEFTTATVSKVRNSYVPHERMYSNVWYKYTFDDGTFFRITGKHRFFDVDTGAYEWSHDIKVGDRVYKIDGTMPKLVSVEKFDERVEYNVFWNKGCAAYFVDGFLSGNATTPIPDIKA